MKTKHALVTAAVLAVASPLALAGEQSAAPTPPAEQAAQPDLAAAAQPLLPGSSDDVNYQIDAARPRPAGLLPRGPVSLIDPVIDEVNVRMKELLGLEFGLAYTTVWQRASDGDIKDAAGGDVDAFLRWRIIGDADSGWRSVIGANGEYRHDIGDYAPRDLGDSFGSMWRTVNGFGVQDAALIQCWWEQHLLDDALVLTLGKLDPDNYYNTHRYQSDSKAFMSKSFSNNPARFHPSNSLGANARVNFGCAGYLSAGIHDANGDKIHSGFSTIDEKEYFTAAEVGWTPDYQDLGRGAYRLELWHVDPRDDAGYPADWGLGLSCEQEVGRGVVPFLRAGWSDAGVTAVERFIGAGVGLEGVLRAKEDLTGIGIAWGDPDDESLDGQWGAEVFHRFQIAPDVQLTLGYQYVLSPTYDAVNGDDPVGIIEVRLRIEF